MTEEPPRQYWVKARPVKPVKGIPSEEWLYIEIWFAPDETLKGSWAARLGEGHQVVENYLNRFSHVVDLERGPLYATADGCVVLATVSEVAE